MVVWQQQDMKWVYDFHKAHKELLLYENHRVRMRNG
jgi:hypothetical protein